MSFIGAEIIFEVGDLADALDRYVQSKVVPAVQRSQEIIVQEAQAHAAVRTGKMRASIHAEPVQIADGKVIGAVAADVDYAVHVEFGTYKMAAQPFMRPALDVSRGAVLKEFDR